MNVKQMRLVAILAILIIIGAINASGFAPRPTGEMTIMSHRGVHQPFSTEGLNNDTCTASRIETPTHDYIENTLTSMQAAFDFGATMIELDVHPTTDGDFAVFHDWTLECRTEASGKVREKTKAQLKALDLGYGYTFDNGQTFPFRGKYIGAMPMLDEALSAFPNHRFLINIKSRSKVEGRLMADYLLGRNVDADRVVLYGHEGPINAFNETYPEVIVFSKQSAKACFIKYSLLGWTSHVPRECRNSWVLVPENFRWAIWGWPNRFQKRMQSVGSEAVLVGPQNRGRANPAIDSPEQLDSIPENFSGTVWTNRVEIIGPLLNQD